MLVLLRKVAIAVLLLSAINSLILRNFVFIWTGLVFCVVAYGSFTSSVRWAPGKNQKTGNISALRLLVFLPYYVVVFCIMVYGFLNTHIRRLESYTKITDDVFVGDYFSSFMGFNTWKSILDITNELPRVGKCSKYLNIQSWDGTPPSPAEIQCGVEFIRKCQKPVLVHCAHGKGRSVTMVVAYLRASGICKSVPEAIQKVCTISTFHDYVHSASY